MIICIRGNGCSRGMDTHMFEDKYDELISLIRSSNKDCFIYVSKIVPRGDNDVSAFNSSVTRIVDHWRAHQVKCINGSYDFLFGRNLMPSSRFFTEDWIRRRCQYDSCLRSFSENEINKIPVLFGVQSPSASYGGSTVS